MYYRQPTRNHHPYLNHRLSTFHVAHSIHETITVVDYFLLSELRRIYAQETTVLVSHLNKLKNKNGYSPI